MKMLVKGRKGLSDGSLSPLKKAARAMIENKSNLIELRAATQLF